MDNQKRTPKQVVSFLLALVMLLISIHGFSNASASEPVESMGPGVASNVGIPSQLDEVINPDTNESMYVANSTFYDYYSDSQVGTGSTPNAIDDGVYGTDYKSTENSFTKFNNVLLKTKNYGDINSSAAQYPLYLGLFFGSQANYDNGDFYFNDSSDKNIAKNFYLAANSSQQGGGNEGAVTNINTATQGLVDNKLDVSGNVTQSNNGKKDVLPYFDKEYLTTTTHEKSSLPLGSVLENVSFPFRMIDKNGVTYYEFDSRKDTIQVDNQGNVKYMGLNKSQVYDQKKEDGTKPGFFPYNTASDSNSTRLNYGFGVKIDIPFNMTPNGQINGQDIIFEFSGDDDVWVFIDGELALDIGGAHSRVEGKINFADMTATVSGVKNNTIAFAQRNWWYLENRNYSTNDFGLNGLIGSNEVVPGIYTNHTTEFSKNLVDSISDTSKVHTLTLFYMERGKIESNMMMNFNLPEPNQLQVTNTVEYNNVNEAFLDDIKTAIDNEAFSFNITDVDMNKQDIQTIGNGESISYINEFIDNDTLSVTLAGIGDSREIYNYYSTKWLLSDMSNAISSSKGRNVLSVSDSRVEEDDCFLFKNLNADTAAKLKVDFYNKVLVNPLSIEKKVKDIASDNNEYTFNVTFSDVFGIESQEREYTGTYDIYEGSTLIGTNTATDGDIIIKAGQRAVIKGIPVNTKYTINEVALDDYYIDSVVCDDITISGFENGVSGTIMTDLIGKNSYVYTNAKEVIPTPEPTVEPTLTPTVEPTLTPTVEPTVVPTIEPTIAPTAEPTVTPTIEPTITPTAEPTVVPTIEPTETPVEIQPEDVPEIVKPAIDSTPKTGDTSNLVLWISLVVISGILVLFTGYKLFYRKKIG